MLFSRRIAVTEGSFVAVPNERPGFKSQMTADARDDEIKDVS
jgi:hypothetical protein